MDDGRRGPYKRLDASPMEHRLRRNEQRSRGGGSHAAREPASSGELRNRHGSGDAPGSMARSLSARGGGLGPHVKGAKPKMKPKNIIAHPQGRSTVGKERFVPLAVEDFGSEGDSDMEPTGPEIFQDIETLQMRGRVTIYCAAESVDLKAVERKILETCLHEGKLEKYPEVIYCQHQKMFGAQSEGDVFFFDYGVVACWGLDEEEEKVVMAFTESCLVDPLDEESAEIDEFTFQYTASEKPHIQNDTVTLNRRFSSFHEVKMSICHAFAQSTKLALFEEQVQQLVEDTREIPEKLAEEGEVHMERKEINKLIGQVFLQKAAVNLLSTVLDTPEFFWSAPDSLQALYKRVCDYLEMDDRVELLNKRFGVLQEMLDMLRDQTNNAHASRLEWIVIWLIVVEVVIGIFECMSILGWVGKTSI